VYCMSQLLNNHLRTWSQRATTVLYAMASTLTYALLVSCLLCALLHACSHVARWPCVLHTTAACELPTCLCTDYSVLHCCVHCCLLAAMSPGGRVCFTPPLLVNYQYDITPGVHMQVRESSSLMLELVLAAAYQDMYTIASHQACTCRCVRAQRSPALHPGRPACWPDA
jgi:hypothetical protein